MSIDNADKTEQPQKLQTGLEKALRDVRNHIKHAGIGVMWNLIGLMGIGGFVFISTRPNYEMVWPDGVMLCTGLFLVWHGARMFITSTYYFITTLIEYRIEYQAKVNLDLLELNKLNTPGHDQPTSPPYR